MCFSIASLEAEHDAEMAHDAGAAFVELLFNVTHSIQTHVSKIRSTVVKAWEHHVANDSKELCAFLIWSGPPRHKHKRQGGQSNTKLPRF